MSIQALLDVLPEEARKPLIARLEAKITALEKQLGDAREMLGVLAGMPIVTVTPLVAAKPKEVRSKKSARKSAGAKKSANAQLTSQQLQGKYLGKLRRVPKSKRAQFQKIARAEGRAAAIKALDSHLA